MKSHILGNLTTMKSISGRGVAVLGFRLYGVLATLIVTVMLARGLGAKDFGIYSLIFAIVSMAALPAQFGIPELVVRDTSVARAKGRLPSILPLWRWSHALCGVISTTIMIVLIIWNALVGFTEFSTIVCATILIPLLAFSKLRSAALRGLGHDILGQFPEHVLRPTLFIFAIVLLSNFTGTLTVELSYIGQAAAFMLTTGVGLVLLWRFAPKAGAAYAHPPQSRDWATSILFIGITASLLVLDSALDVIMIGIWASDEEVGRYRIAATFAATITLGLQTLNEFSMPYFAALHENSDRAGIERLARRVAQASLFLGFCAIVFILLVGEPLISLAFGEEFSGAFPILLVLAVGYLLNAFLGPANTLLIIAQKERLVAAIVALGSASNLALNLLLIPIYGAIGAAVSTSISVSLTRVVMLISARREIGVLCAAIPFPKFYSNTGS